MTEDIERMVRKIPKIANGVESLFHDYVVDQLISSEFNLELEVEGCKVDSVIDEIHRVLQEIALVNEALTTMEAAQEQPTIKATQEHQIAGDKPQNNDNSLTNSGGKNKPVGFDDLLKRVLEKITGKQQNLVVVPIVGMGGIGKTTLAKSVFDHPSYLDHFYVRIWLTISQDYSVKNLLQGLSEDGVLGVELGAEKSEAELITQLYQILFGRRYLVVLDDVWSSNAWDDLRRCFPNNGKGSRVIVTTRLSRVANYLDSGRNNSYSMKFLDEDKSWDLFSEKAFERGGRSLEREEIGREISKRCKGLPLLLVVVGGLLANSNMTVEYWQAVREDINSFANSAYDEYCLRTLSLSYNQLPIHLKPCFLYMRHLEEDSKVDVSKLIITWVSQGFVKPIEGKTLEEAAAVYFEDLVGRNMLLIRESPYDSNIKFCGIHDLLRDLCIKESEKEQLVKLPKTISVSRELYNQCFHCNEGKAEMKKFHSEIIASAATYIVGMWVCSYCESAFQELARSRIVFAVKLRGESFPTLTTYRQVTIRPSNVSVFRTIRLFWNLESLVISDYGLSLPKAIWEMPQLRHVEAHIFKIGAPASNVTVLENLQTFTTISQFQFTEEIVERIPNVRKLGVRHEGGYNREGEGTYFDLHCLARLQKLESLTIEYHKMYFVDLVEVTVFPCQLKELTLSGCEIYWYDMKTINSSLPHLQVLKLLWKSVSGKEWDPVGRVLSFPKLKYLELRKLDLVRWTVDHEIQFQALDTLVLATMNDLDEIPPEIGELPSLKSIYLEDCNERVIDSARDIIEEQQSNGNEGVVLHVKEWGRPIYQVGGVNHV